MTRRLILVNASNWENEEYSIFLNKGGLPDDHFILAQGEYKDVTNRFSRDGRLDATICELFDSKKEAKYKKPHLRWSFPRA